MKVSFHSCVCVLATYFLPIVRFNNCSFISLLFFIVTSTILCISCVLVGNNNQLAIRTMNATPTTPKTAPEQSPVDSFAALLFDWRSQYDDSSAPATPTAEAETQQHQTTQPRRSPSPSQFPPPAPGLSRRRQSSIFSASNNNEGGIHNDDDGYHGATCAFATDSLPPPPFMLRGPLHTDQ